MKLKRLLATALVLSFLSPGVLAESVNLSLSSDLAGQDDIYTVEIVLFQQASPSVNQEVWPDDFMPLDYSDETRLRQHDGMPMSLNETLARTDFALNGEASRLSRNGYSVLYHNSWVQKFSPNSKTKLVLTDPNLSLEGTLNIERQRFLHVYPDIRLDLRSILGQNAPVVRMQESRRMRSSELHYIDHPVLGMLVLFRPVSGT